MGSGTGSTASFPPALLPDGNTKSITIHSLEHACAALSAATALSCPVILQSAPGAAGNLGAMVFNQIISQAANQYPQAQCIAILDCADNAGLALNALRNGVKHISVDLEGQALIRISDIAEQSGATLMKINPLALDLKDVNYSDTSIHDWLLKDH